jgi:hypothetical protein
MMLGTKPLLPTLFGAIDRSKKANLPDRLFGFWFEGIPSALSYFKWREQQREIQYLCPLSVALDIDF